MNKMNIENKVNQENPVINPVIEFKEKHYALILDESGFSSGIGIQLDKQYQPKPL